ncbi:MAG TPA: class I SAM-dependent methyltransferase [Vicinamibacterales bacterium]|jgi:trans-aconitate 2-methyltransferase
MSDWNADRYHALSIPQQTWGRRVLERLPLDGSEHVLDLGCGTGRITSELAARVPRGRVVALDRSAAMLSLAQAWLREHAPSARLVMSDGAALPFNRTFDAVFSGATFHWIHDHAALFRSIVLALKPGGRLVAQCGGGPNLALLLGRAGRLMQDPRFAHYFEGWTEPTYFSDVDAAGRRMRTAGFVDIDVSLEAAPTAFAAPAEFEEFVANVCVRGHLARLPSHERRLFLRELTLAAAADGPPLTLDYWRLNLSGRRPA